MRHQFRGFRAALPALLAGAAIGSFFCGSIASTHNSSKDFGSIGGKQPDGYVVLDKKKFKLKEAVPLKFKIVNNTKKTIDYWVTRFCLDHSIVVRDETGKSVPLTEEGLRWRGLFLSPNRRGNVNVELKPEMTYIDELGKNLDDLFVLRAGNYYVQIYFVDNGQKPSVVLSTLPTQFTIADD